MGIAEKPDNVAIASLFTVAAFYKFVRLRETDSLKKQLTEICKENEIYGTMLLASEGINGTISGKEQSINKLFEWLKVQPNFNDIQVKISISSKQVFHRLKVRLKKEIVTMGEPDIDPNKAVGTYVKPENWNNFINDPDTLIIDTRNQYEVEIGTFKNALSPQTKSFRGFPDWVQAKLDTLPHHKRPKQIAMFCTGGIRCEKATSYLANKGYNNVFHLEGGILKYLETISEVESTWNGDCFVFDQRVSVEHGLIPGKYKLCHACRMPLKPTDLKAKEYQLGVSCPKCYGSQSPQQKKRFKDRQLQVELAEKRGGSHIGSIPGKHR